MIKDKSQKLCAIRYCVAVGMIPHREVAVRFSADIGKASSDITDVDVLGVRPAGLSTTQRVIFDCKTLKGVSPINRALWAKGLSELIGASEAFIILSKAAPDGHRLAGNSLGVRLFTDQLFDIYAMASNGDYGATNSYIEFESSWDALEKVGSKYPALAPLLQFLNSSAPLIWDAKQGLRALISTIRHVEKELDPAKAEHRAVYLLTLQQLMIFLAELVREFHSIFDPAGGIESFEPALRYFVWGGRESYEMREKLHKAVRQNKGVEASTLDLPGWPRFLETFRSMLDAPSQPGSCCLPLMDLAFRELGHRESPLDIRLAGRLTANRRIRQFIGIASSYLADASTLPRDFRTHLLGELSTLQGSVHGDR